MNRPVMKKGILKRLIKMLFESYPRLLVVTICFITLNAVVSSLPAIFMKNVIGIVNNSYKSGDWSSVSNEVLKLVLILGILYLVSLVNRIVQQKHPHTHHLLPYSIHQFAFFG